MAMVTSHTMAVMVTSHGLVTMTTSRTLAVCYGNQFYNDL